jgi:Protein of unknown function (DUF2530)
VRLRVRPEDRRPDPAPLATDDRRAVALGTAVWAVLLVLAAVQHDRLAAQGRGWWLWVCVAGVLLGGVGLLHLRRRARR